MGAPARECRQRVSDVPAVGPRLARPAVLFDDGDEIHEPLITDKVVNEMMGRPHPDLRGDLEVELRQTLLEHQAAICGTTGESRALRSDNKATHRGMDPIGANKDVDRRGRAVLEHHVDVIVAIGERN